MWLVPLQFLNFFPHSLGSPLIFWEISTPNLYPIFWKFYIPPPYFKKEEGLGGGGGVFYTRCFFVFILIFCVVLFFSVAFYTQIICIIIRDNPYQIQVSSKLGYFKPGGWHEKGGIIHQNYLSTIFIFVSTAYTEQRTTALRECQQFKAVGPSQTLGEEKHFQYAQISIQWSINTIFLGCNNFFNDLLPVSFSLFLCFVVKFWFSFSLFF